MKGGEGTMAINTKITANKRPGVQKGSAAPAPAKDFGSATKYAEFSKTDMGVTGQPRPKVPSPGTPSRKGR
jgi:hypothetical protein